MNATMKYKKEKEVHDYIDSIWDELTQHAKDVICLTDGRSIVELFGDCKDAKSINEFVDKEWSEDEE